MGAQLAGLAIMGEAFVEFPLRQVTYHREYREIVVAPKPMLHVASHIQPASGKEDGDTSDGPDGCQRAGPFVPSGLTIVHWGWWHFVEWDAPPWGSYRDDGDAAVVE